MTCGICDEETDGAYLCERDTLALAARLADLPALYDEVTECLVPRGHGWGDVVATKSAAGPRAPLNEDVIDTTNTVRAAELTHMWRVDVQRVRWPQHAAPLPAGLAADCRWLGMELEWIAGQYPGAGDFAREMRELEGQARSIVGDPVPRRQRIGLCVAVTDDQGTVCGAVLSRLPGEPLTCRWCRTEYRTEQDLLLLKHYQPQPEPGTSLSG
ncbi:hypothetical protein ABZX85_41665 [Streptomyces sp. NPDC004539]|uniref:hypothetical protein n=1 Tax=Streptomyces sp. NPDC004539 TaxID=3154280 RepID=UPI0033BA288D